MNYFSFTSTFLIVTRQPGGQDLCQAFEDEWPIPPPFNARCMSVIDPTSLILKSSRAGKCADTPGELLAVENQCVPAGCSQAFEQQFQQHSASTGVLAPRCKPAGRDIASVHIVQAVISYCSGLYQGCPTDSPGSPAL